MFRKFLLGISIFAFAFAILSVSMLESVNVAYVSASTVNPSPTPTPKPEEIDYEIVYVGRILPDSSLWSLKAGRDRLLYIFTFNHLKKAELALLFSDKRLISSRTLFESKKPDIGLSTLTKGEKYLEIAVKEELEARKKGLDTSKFLDKLAKASLKHRQIIENDIIPLTPEDAKAEVVKTTDYSKNAYKSSRDALNSKGLITPKDPFEGL